MAKKIDWDNPPDWVLKGPVNLENYDRRVWWYGRNIKKWGDRWPYISNDEGDTVPTADQREWEKYFLRVLGGFPKSYRLFKSKNIKHFNFPEARPELFDPVYTP